MISGYRILPFLSALLLALPWLSDFLFWWSMPVALVPLLIFEDRCWNQGRLTLSSFQTNTFLAFFLWNILATWWIAKVTITGMLTITCLNALLMTLVWWFFHRLRQHMKGRSAYLGLVSFWMGFEYFNHNYEFSWPWLTLGNAMAEQPALIQWIEYTGIQGASLWILVANLILFSAWKAYEQGKNRIAAGRTMLFALIIIAPIIFSSVLYTRYKLSVPSTEIVIIQPNINPFTEKFDELTQLQQAEIMVRLADSLTTPNTVWIVAPETALQQVNLSADSNVHHGMNHLMIFLERNLHVHWVTGALTSLNFPPRPGSSSSHTSYYNSALCLGSGIQLYHKNILVSGVEKLPFSGLLPFPEKWLVNLGGTSQMLNSGDNPAIFHSGSSSAAPVICYESLFGNHVRKSVIRGAELIFIITNDGWWENTPGYRQHFSYSRLRAIENRRVVVRSANTGISAFINERGDIMQSTTYGEATALSAKAGLQTTISYYSRHGNYIGRISTLVAVLFLLFLFSRRKIKDSPQRASGGKDKKNPH